MRRGETCEYLRAIGIQDGVFAVLRAALDASSCQPAWIYAVAGYVAPPEDWEPALERWQEALDQWKLERFHLAELPKLVGFERTKMCEGYFARIIEKSDLHSVGSAIFTADWEQPDWGDDRSPRFAKPYDQSLWFALNVLGEHCQLEFPDQEVAVVCDVDGPEVAMQAVFREAQKVRPNLHSLGVSNSFKRKELQIADLAAGYLRRSWVDITTDENCAIPWGVIPKSKKGRTSVWSLRQNAILARSIGIHKRRVEAEGDKFYIKIKPNDKP